MAWLIACVVTGGCADGPARDSPTRSVHAAPPSPARSPANPATEPARGLEGLWWVADDSEGAVGQALAVHLNPPLPDNAGLRERWESSGLRLVRVPIDRLDEIQAAAPAVSQRYRLPIGWTTAWTEVFRGRRVGGETVKIAGVGRAPPRGVVRLLARCWPLPGTASAQLDLLVQVEAEAGAETRDPFKRPEILPEDRQGEAVRELTLESAVAPGFAYVITCEEPGVRWMGPAEAGGESGFSPPPVEAPDESMPVKDPLAPLLGVTRTLGEAALASSTEGDPRRKHKAVIALIVRGSGEYRLLP